MNLAIGTSKGSTSLATTRKVSIANSTRTTRAVGPSQRRAVGPGRPAMTSATACFGSASGVQNPRLARSPWKDYLQRAQLGGDRGGRAAELGVVCVDPHLGFGCH